MTNKKIIFAVTAVILAVGIIITTEKMSSVRPPEHRTKIFPRLEERHVTALLIRDGSSAVMLSSLNGAWTASVVSGGESDDPLASIKLTSDTAAVKADSASVRIAIEKVVSLKKGEPVSNNPANQAALGVDTASGMLVSVFTNGNNDAPAEVLIIGKIGSSWNSNYVRALGSDAVYLVQEGLRHTFFTELDRWKASGPEPSDAATAEPEPEPEE